LAKYIEVKSGHADLIMSLIRSYELLKGEEECVSRARQE